MDTYKREYPLLSLCGLNCGLCPRYHTKRTSRCPGCGGEAFYEKHPSCGVVSCAKGHGGVQFCSLCAEYPCKKYYDSEKIKDSFITKQRQLADFEKLRRIGLAAYRTELGEKMEILRHLLDVYDGGRRKNFYCLAVNLLELADIKDVMAQIDAGLSSDAAPKEEAAAAVRLFGEMADKRAVLLELRK
jgi:hypothetical protein